MPSDVPLLVTAERLFATTLHAESSFAWGILWLVGSGVKERQPSPKGCNPARVAHSTINTFQHNKNNRETTC